ncbi:MAG: hypothetical protein KDE22_01595 [Rhodobacterales bacterium]|nr:hypothetical protein [Rhodobacterales bacterium]
MTYYTSSQAFMIGIMGLAALARVVRPVAVRKVSEEVLDRARKMARGPYRTLGDRGPGRAPK